MTTPVSRAVLLIEDDASVGKAIAESMRLAGHRCEWVSTAQQAFEVLSAPHEFDVVFLDLQLGEERSEELIERLVRVGVSLPPLVIVSGRPNAELRVAGRVTQAAAWLKKPVSIASMTTAIELALDPFSTGA
jgi:DNA-binding response OmpR family regulator